MNLDDFELFFVDAEEEKCYIENDDDLQAAYLYSWTFSTAMLKIFIVYKHGLTDEERLGKWKDATWKNNLIWHRWTKWKLGGFEDDN